MWYLTLLISMQVFSPQGLFARRVLNLKRHNKGKIHSSLGKNKFIIHPSNTQHVITQYKAACSTEVQKVLNYRLKMFLMR